MFIKKRDKGGFINPNYERVNVMLGWVALIAVCLAFLFVFAMMVKEG